MIHVNVLCVNEDCVKTAPWPVSVVIPHPPATGMRQAGFMYSADADGRGHFKFFYFLFFWAYIDLHAQLERDPESDRLGHPPPPPTHHDPMKIY